AGALLVHEHLGRQRVRTRMHGRRAAAAHDLELGDAARLAALRLDLRDERVAPCVGRVLEIDVAVDAVVHALRAEGLEPGVERASDRAEVLVARITEREHRVAELLEPRRTVAHPELEERLGALRRIPEPMRCDDERRLLDTPQALRVEVAEIDELRSDPYVIETLLDGLRDTSTVASLRRVEDRPPSRRRVVLLRRRRRRVRS